MPSHLYLIGLPGAGKSTLGRELAAYYQRPFLDLDAVIVAEAGQSIPAIFAAEGEAGFRRREAAAQDAWRGGRTGYPIVDAGMRQLWRTGWMHNRVRMITASFFVKQLLQPWEDGAAWFWDTLVDADLANNTLGWQWSAGCGADAAPYFRIFNPVTQGLRFDPDGEYVRRWVPELAHLPGKAAHEPWKHPDGYQHNYPRRIIDHAVEREVALERYRSSRS